MAKVTLEELRANLARMEENDRKRWERINNCEVEDTDCFLSNWASNWNMREVKAQIEILENGGYAPIRTLVRIDGEKIKATRCDTRYGIKYRVERADGSVEWVDPFVKDKTLTKKGYEFINVMKPAWAKLDGASMTAMYISVYPTKNGFNYATGEYEGNGQ